MGLDVFQLERGSRKDFRGADRLAFSPDPPVTGRNWIRDRGGPGSWKDSKSCGGEMAGTQPDKAATVVESRDGTRFLSLPLSDLVCSLAVNTRRCPLLNEKTTRPHLCFSSPLSRTPSGSVSPSGKWAQGSSKSCGERFRF